MNSEKDLLERSLNTLGKDNKKEIEKFVEDAELLMGHEDLVARAQEMLTNLNNKAEEVQITPDSQISQVNELDGNNNEIEKRTENVDAEIDAVKVEMEQEIKTATDEVDLQNNIEGGSSKEAEREIGEVGYDNALNMYASSLTNPADLEKYKDVFAKLSPEDKAKIEQGVVGLQIKDAMLNWGVPEVETKFSENMENYSKMFPGSVESAKIYSTMTTPNFNPTKFQEMYSVSGEQLGRMLQDAKDKIIEDIKKEESIDTNNLRLQYSELINTTKDSDEKSRLERTLQVKVSEIIDVSTKNKIGKINEDYQKRLEQVNH